MRYLSLLVLAVLAGCASSTGSVSNPNSSSFQLTSPTIQDGQVLPSAQVYSGYGCTGENLSPELAWLNPPAGTKSFVVSMRDPDAQNGAGFQHWFVYDIPSSATGLPAGIGVSSSLPDGAKSAANSFGLQGYAGACPPAGDQPHHYVFTVYALNSEHFTLPVSDASTVISIPQETQLGQASLSAVYSR